MAVVFAPPAPVGALGIGQIPDPYMLARLYSQGTAALAEIGMNAARIAGQKSIAQLEADTRAAIANAQIIADRESDQERILYQDAWQKMNAGLEASAIAARVAMTEMNNQAQMWMQDRELTHRDMAEWRRLQDAVSAINQDPNLSQEDKSAMILRLRTKIDPYEVRHERARLHQLEVQRDQTIQNAKLMNQIRNAETRDAAMTFLKDAIVTLKDPQTGEESLFQFNPNKGGLEHLMTRAPIRPPAEKPISLQEKLNMAGLLAKTRALGDFPPTNEKDVFDRNVTKRAEAESRYFLDMYNRIISDPTYLPGRERVGESSASPKRSDGSSAVVPGPTSSPAWIGQSMKATDMTTGDPVGIRQMIDSIPRTGGDNRLLFNGLPGTEESMNLFQMLHQKGIDSIRQRKDLSFKQKTEAMDVWNKMYQLVSNHSSPSFGAVGLPPDKKKEYDTLRTRLKEILGSH